MIKRNLNDLLSFAAVAREGTFTVPPPNWA